MEEEYKKYPIYKFTVWVKDNSVLEQSMVARKMFKEEQSLESLRVVMDKFIENILNRKEWTIEIKDSKPSRFETMSAKEAGLYITKSEFSLEPEYESWMLTWFSHETIDDGEDDKYFFNSFMDFVDRMQRRNREEGEMKTFPSGNRFWDEPVCLMGAEDMWRWHSWTYDDDFDRDNPETSKIHRSDKLPCRCIYCKERGIVQINH